MLSRGFEGEFDEQIFSGVCLKMRWIVNLDGGPRRVNHAAAAVGETIFSFGGYCTGEDYKNKRPMDVHILNTVSLRWSVLPSLKPRSSQYNLAPFQRYGHTANPFNDCIYIWGGRNDLRACNRVFCFNASSREWEAVVVQGKAPGARDGHTSCIIQEKLYIFGGYEEDLNQFSQDIYALHLKTMTWIQVKARGIPPRRRDFHSATALGSCMYIFGGRSGRMSLFLTPDDEIYCNQLTCFDTSTNTWSELKCTGVKPAGRRSHSAFVYQNHLYIFGGYNGILNIHYNDVFKYNPQSQQWATVKTRGRVPTARRRQCCCMVGHRLYLFGGTSPCPLRATVRAASLLPTVENLDPNLIDHNDLNVLDFSPTLKTLCELAVIEYGLDRSALPRDIEWELEAMTTNNSVSWTGDRAG